MKVKDYGWEITLCDMWHVCMNQPADTFYLNPLHPTLIDSKLGNSWYTLNLFLFNATIVMYVTHTETHLFNLIHWRWGVWLIKSFLSVPHSCLHARPWAGCSLPVSFPFHSTFFRGCYCLFLQLNCFPSYFLTFLSHETHSINMLISPPHNGPLPPFLFRSSSHHVGQTDARP